MKVKFLLFVLLLLNFQAFALKSRERTFAENCDVVWKASMAVAKSQEYRIVGVSKEEQIISLAVGGFMAGERIISLNLTSLNGDGCTVSVQSRFSGLIHSDGPDLLRRIELEIVGNSLDRDSKAFKHFKDCLEWAKSEKCEKRLREDLERDAAKASKPELPKDNTPSMEGWWKNAPATAKKEKP